MRDWLLRDPLADLGDIAAEMLRTCLQRTGERAGAESSELSSLWGAWDWRDGEIFVGACMLLFLLFGLAASVD